MEDTPRLPKPAQETLTVIFFVEGSVFAVGSEQSMGVVAGALRQTFSMLKERVKPSSVIEFIPTVQPLPDWTT